MTPGSLTVTRSIPLTTSAKDAVALLAGAPGVSSVEVTGNRRLRVSYDPRHIRFDDVERILDDGGAMPAGGIFHSLARSWARFTEANLVDQSRIAHQCCNIPPTGRKAFMR